MLDLRGSPHAKGLPAEGLWQLGKGGAVKTLSHLEEVRVEDARAKEPEKKEMTVGKIIPVSVANASRASEEMKKEVTLADFWPAEEAKCKVGRWRSRRSFTCRGDSAGLAAKEEEKVKEEESDEDDFIKVTSRRKRRQSKRVKFCEEASCDCSCAVSRLSLLETVSPVEEVNSMADEWEEVSIAVDSGATETVVSAEMGKSVRTVPGAASRARVKYAMANAYGETVENEGESTC